jgi:Protein of unknown function (DUF2950)
MRTTSWQVTALLVSVITLASCRQLSDSGQQLFDSPDAAAEALARAVISADTNALFEIMGPDSRALIMPADQVQGARDRQVVKAALAEKWWLEGEGDSARTIVMGNESWPFPVPIVRANGGWRFDIEAGREELRYRRVGANETAVMEVAVAFVEAQHEYASRPRNGQPSGVYAQRIASQPGRQDGLYWAVSSTDSPVSPMGELAARAAADGYTRADTGRTAYHGYYYKVLTAQGPNVPGGSRSWVTGGLMRGGFGLLAWPADYGDSGIMTFIVGPDGVIREKDLGSETPRVAPAIDAFDPDSTWSLSTNR